MTDLASLDRDARQRAIDPRGSFIVQAPAGSGKTSLLTLRFLALLATVERPEEIVAITFTRKAAAEMRHRLQQALLSAASPLSPGAPPHQRDLHRYAAAALARSRERGWGLEHNPARLHLQTIDGLNLWLARHLPLAARIGTAAALVERADRLYAEAARRTVLRLEENSPLAEGLLRLARGLDHRPQNLARLIEGMLGARELWLPKLLGGGQRGSLRADIDRLLAAALECELNEVSGRVSAVDLSEVLAICRRAGAAGGSGPALALAGLADWPSPTADARAQWIALRELLLTAHGEPGILKQVGTRQGFLAAAEGPAWAPLKREMKAALGKLAAHAGLAPALARLRRLPPAALTDGHWQRIEALGQVLPQAVAELLALMAECDQLDYPAIAAAARDALGDESAPTDLALTLDYRIRHLLVDEYQDTSPSQARLLELLVAGWQRGDGRTLFCVGDPMQSIYGFREADVTLFLQAQRLGIGGVALANERLGHNFRSSAPIVDWVNATFSARMPEQDDFERGAVRYSPASATRASTGDDGVVVHALIEADDSAMAAETARIAASAIARSPGASVAILVRTRASLSPILAALRTLGIEYRGVDLETLPDRPAMRDLVALCKALLHAGDRAAWLAVLRAPWCGLGLADLLALAGDDGVATIPERIADPAVQGSLSAAGRARLARCASALDAAVRGRGTRSLGGWLNSAWLALDGPATMEDPSDIANSRLVFTALDRLQQEAGSRPQASAIDAAIGRVMASPVGGESALVQVMTIHRAKGLEFDVVILPDLQRVPLPDKRRLLYWTPIATASGERGIVLGSRAEDVAATGGTDALERWMRQIEGDRRALELGRLAYVATTRARLRLHLIGSAAVERKSGVRRLGTPRAGSLLGFLWPAVRPDFERALGNITPAADAARTPGGRRRLGAPQPRRLVAGFSAPLPPAPPAPRTWRIASEPEGPVRPEFNWAGTIAQSVGEVVHRELHRVARLALRPAGGAAAAARWRRELLEAGIDENHLPAALARVEAAIDALGTSELAARLLDPGASEIRSELALSALMDGTVHGLRIDRTFVDAEGVRWVVDWKTSLHEGGDREGFLDNELVRYRSQLERYARAMRLIDPGRPLKVGLYFPLLDAWRGL